MQRPPHAVVLNGERTPPGRVAGALADALASGGWAATPFVLRDLAIADCTGCLGCWIRTPGLCVIRDAAGDIARALVNSRLVAFLTPVTFGGYSSELKKALDRSICLAQPFFRRVRGEVHHVPRYDWRPALLAIGTLPAPDPAGEPLFAALVARNAANLNSASHAAGIVYDTDAPEAVREKIRGWLDALA
jgi:hypothetical protein